MSNPSPPPPQQQVVPPAPAAGKMSGRLLVRRAGQLTDELFTFGGKGPICIGRFDPSSGPVDIDLSNLPESPYVSRRHAELSCDASGQWRLKDLGARSGVFVRRRGEAQFARVTGEQAISSGDEFALGNAKFEFHVD